MQVGADGVLVLLLLLHVAAVYKPSDKGSDRSDDREAYANASGVNVISPEPGGKPGDDEADAEEQEDCGDGSHDGTPP